MNAKLMYAIVILLTEQSKIYNTPSCHEYGRCANDLLLIQFRLNRY